ncbi:MAG: hypothetical protein PUE81_02735 [Lachnospiraceae bacterium]|nr:hypothetical protein [Lachnospiraceae bacterium]
MNCGTKLPDWAKFCMSCGCQIENAKTNLSHEATNKDESNHRRMLSERPIKVSNRYDISYEDPEITDLIDNNGLGFEVLSPSELNEVLKGTSFDNEEDLADIIYHYSSRWKNAELEEADKVFQNDEGYHAAIGCCYARGDHSCIERDYDKALYHLNKALDLPVSIRFILAIYGEKKDFVNMAKFVKLGMRMDVPAAYYYMGLLFEGGLGGIEKDESKANEYYHQAIEKAQGKEKERFIHDLGGKTTIQSAVNEQGEQEEKKDGAGNKQQDLPREEIKFSIVDGWTIKYDRRLEKQAALFGQFLKKAYDEAYDLIHKYNNYGTIEMVLQHIPDMAQKAIDDVIGVCLKILYDNNINMSAQQFIGKYYYDHKIDYEPYYKEAINRYAEIKQNKEALARFRETQKASRSRWQGGGFGVSGAIKGAVTASVMNIGTDFVRSFGDAAINRNDNAQINNQLKNLYNDKKIKSNMCWGVYWCIKHAYEALAKELMSKGIFINDRLDEKGARTLFDNAGQFAENREEYVSKVIECILMYPGEEDFYHAIMPELVAHKGDDFERLLKFWNIEFLGDEYRKKKKEELDRVKKEGLALEKKKIENGRAQLFDALFDTYKTKYEKENGKIKEINPKVYYEFIRPCLHEYCYRTGIYNESNKIFALDLAFGFDDDIDIIPEEALCKSQLNDYLLYLRRINRNGGFMGDEYINNMPRFINLKAFLSFISKVEMQCMGEGDFFFNGQFYLNTKITYQADDYPQRGLEPCINEEIFLQKEEHAEKMFSDEYLLSFMITEKHLAIRCSKKEYITLELDKIKSIGKQGDKVYVSDGINEGYIETRMKNNSQIIQFMDVMYCMLRDYYGCNIEMSFD